MSAFRRWILLVLGVTAAVGAESFRLPVPPHQRTPWRPSAGALPTNLLSAANALFAQGFPDPRGCEYREFEVRVGNAWTPQAVSPRASWQREPPETNLWRRTRGWVLPPNANHPQPFAICWNGLIYPVTNVGAVVDVHAEATNLPPLPRLPAEVAAGEIMAVFPSNAPSTRVLLLLRAGETEVARRQWQSNRVAMRLLPEPGRGPWQNPARLDPYIELATEWAWAMFDRLINAHVRGEDALALAAVRTLSDLQPRLEAEAARRGFPPPSFAPPLPPNRARPDKPQPLLDFLAQLPALRQDLERRGREGGRERIGTEALAQIENSGDRISARIRELDLLPGRQSGPAGQVDLNSDRLLGDLVNEGEAAVEPLLKCWETDLRLTRSVRFGRDSTRRREIVPVADAARSAVQAILQSRFDSAAHARAYWNRFRSLSLPERWYSILRDDAAGMNRWLEASRLIVRAEPAVNVASVGGRGSGPVKAGAHKRLAGEALRDQSAPSVTELLTRRATEVPANRPGDYDLPAACEIALCLAVWDAAAGASLAGQLLGRSRLVLDYSAGNRDYQRERLSDLLPQLAIVGAEQRNPVALAEYAGWLQSTTPERLGLNLEDSLSPLLKFGTNEILRATAERLFATNNPSWGKLPWRAYPGFDPLATDLVRLPAFRRMLERELNRTEACGWFIWETASRLRFQFTVDARQTGTLSFTLPAGDSPAPGTRSEMRRCDWLAVSLTNAKLIAAFNPFAPVAERDRRIGDARAALLAP